MISLKIMVSLIHNYDYGVCLKFQLYFKSVIVGGAGYVYNTKCYVSLTPVHVNDVGDLCISFDHEGILIFRFGFIGHDLSYLERQNQGNIIAHVLLGISTRS